MRLGFIGVGKIASAVIEGLCTSGLRDISLILSPRNEANGRRLADRYRNVVRAGSNQEVLDQAEIIFIALRPAAAVVELSKLQFRERHDVVSFIPLLSYAELSVAVAPASHVSRAIPLPSVVNHNCPIPVFQASRDVLDIFRTLGEPLKVENEEQLHAVWTLTGLISPFFNLLDELARWTTDHGVDHVTANRYVADMFRSLTVMAAQQERIDFGELASHAATPNGMNEQAAKEIALAGAHNFYKLACNNLLKRFG